MRVTTKAWFILIATVATTGTVITASPLNATNSIDHTCAADPITGMSDCPTNEPELVFGKQRLEQWPEQSLVSDNTARAHETRLTNAQLLQRCVYQDMSSRLTMSRMISESLVAHSYQGSSPQQAAANV